MSNKATLPQHGITKEEWEQFHDLWTKILPIFMTLVKLKASTKGEWIDFPYAMTASSSKHQTGPNTAIYPVKFDRDPYDGGGEIRTFEEAGLSFYELEFPAETEMRLKKEVEDKKRADAQRNADWERAQYERLKAKYG